MVPKLEQFIDSLCETYWRRQLDFTKKLPHSNQPEYRKTSRHSLTTTRATVTSLLEAHAAEKDLKMMAPIIEMLSLDQPEHMLLTKFLCEETKEMKNNSQLAGHFLRETWVQGHMNYGVCSFGYELPQVIDWFKYVDKNTLMDAAEIAYIGRLFETADCISIYRGVAATSSSEIAGGISWTLDPKVAESFAERSASRDKKNGFIISATADPQNILAYFHERGEQEIVIDYKTLSFPQIHKEIGYSTLSKALQPKIVHN